MNKHHMLIALALVSTLGCAGDIEEAIENPVSNELGDVTDFSGGDSEFIPDAQSTGQELTQCAAKMIRQGDGSACQWCNCGLASAAMLRYVMTCGTESHSGATMRTYYNRYYGISGCGSGNSGSTCGSDPGKVANLMEVVHNYDGGPNKSATTYNYVWNELSLSTFKTRLGTGDSGGYSAIVNGAATATRRRAASPAATASSCTSGTARTSTSTIRSARTPRCGSGPPPSSTTGPGARPGTSAPRSAGGNPGVHGLTSEAPRRCRGA